MPVTFESNDIKLNPYSYTPQLPLDEMFKGLGYKQSEYDQGVQQARSIVQNTANILRGEGPDAPVADKLKQELNEQLQQASKLDFSDPNSISQLAGFVSKFTSRPEVTALAAHNFARENYLRQVKDLEAKGKTVSPDLQPIYQQIQNYDRSNTFDPNVRFTGSVVPDYDFDKFYERVQKLPSQKETTVDALGNTRTKEYRSPEQITDLAIQDPEYINFHRRVAESAWSNLTQGQDDNSFAKQKLNSDIASYRNDQIEANQELQYARQLKDPAYTAAAQKRLDHAQKQLAEAQNILLSGPAAGAALKNKFINDHLKGELAKLAGSYSYVAQTADASGTREKLREEADYAREMAVAKYKIDHRTDGLAKDPFATLQEFYNLTKDPAKLDSTLVTQDAGGGAKKFSATEIGDLSEINDRPMIGWDKVRMSGDSKDWVQYNGKINSIDDFSGNTVVKLSGEGDQQLVTVTSPNIQYGTDGKPLQFINSKTKQIAFASTGADGKPTWEVIDYPALGSKLQAHATSNGLKHFTYPLTYDALDKQMTGQPVTQVPPGMVHIKNPNGSVVEIPKDSANSYIKAYPGSKQQ